MANFDPPFSYPSLVHANRFARNQTIPLATYHSRSANALNHVLAYRKRLICSYGRDLTNVPIGASGTVDLYRCATRIGYGTGRVFMYLGLLPASDASSTDPRVQLSVTEVGVGTTTSDALHCPGIDTSLTMSPSAIWWGGVVDDVTAGGEYEFSMQLVDYARIVSFGLWELGDVPLDGTSTAVADPNYSVGQPMYDAEQQDLIQGSTHAWKRNGAQLIAWTADSQVAAAPTVTGTTWTNLLDGLTTGNSAATQGMDLETTYHNSATESEVPVELKVYASQSGAGDGEVRLTDSTGSQISVGTISTAGWYSATGTFPAGNTKTDIEARCDGAGTVTVHAVSLYEYEA